MKCNKFQIETVVRMAEEKGAGSVKFNIVAPVANGEQMYKARETLLIEELVELGEWVENDLVKKINIKLFFNHPPAFAPLSRLTSKNGRGLGICGIHNIIGVLGDGLYALCGIGESISELVFGDANKDKLEDIWNDNPILKQIREGIPDR